MFGSVVSNAKMSTSVCFAFLHYPDGVQRVQMPAKKANGRVVEGEPNRRTGAVRQPPSFSAKLVQGTTQRFSIPSQRRQFGDVTLRTLVTPGSEFLPLSAKTGEGKCFSGLYQPSPCARTLYRRVVIMNNLLSGARTGEGIYAIGPNL